MRYPLRSLVITLWALGLAGTPTAWAQNKCVGAKIKASAVEANCLLVAESKSAKTGDALDAVKVQKCRDKLSATFLKSEEKLSCPTIGDASDIDTMVSDFVGDVVSALAVGIPNTCQAAKIKAAGVKAKCLLVLDSKAATTGTPAAPEKVQKCKDKLMSTFAKLEVKGGCATAEDAQDIEDRIDAFEADAVVALSPPGLPVVAISPILHIDASNSSNLTLDGSEVDGATDLSGNGNHMQPSANLIAKPTFASGGIKAGQGSIRFANSKALQTVNQAPFDVGSFTAFVVFRVSAFDEWNFVLGDDNYTWSSGWGLEANNDDLGAYANGGPAERVTLLVDATYVAAVVYDGTSIVSYLNGVLQTTDTSVLGFDSTPFKFSLGNSDYTVDAWGLDGWVGEAAFYAGVLTSTDRDAVTAFLIGKWN